MHGVGVLDHDKENFSVFEYRHQVNTWCSLKRDNQEEEERPYPGLSATYPAANLTGRREGVIGIETPCLSAYYTGGRPGSHSSLSKHEETRAEFRKEDYGGHGLGDTPAPLEARGVCGAAISQPQEP
jgi:hypothetical protein